MSRFINRVDDLRGRDLKGEFINSAGPCREPFMRDVRTVGDSFLVLDHGRTAWGKVTTKRSYYHPDLDSRSGFRRSSLLSISSEGSKRKISLETEADENNFVALNVSQDRDSDERVSLAFGYAPAVDDQGGVPTQKLLVAANWDARRLQELFIRGVVRRDKISVQFTEGLSEFVETGEESRVEGLRREDGRGVNLVLTPRWSRLSVDIFTGYSEQHVMDVTRNSILASFCIPKNIESATSLLDQLLDPMTLEASLVSSVQADKKWRFAHIRSLIGIGWHHSR